MPYELLSTGNVLISSDTRSGLFEEIDKFVMEHNPDTMNIRSMLKGNKFTTFPSGGGSRERDARSQVSDVPMYKRKTWSAIYEYTENAEKVEKDKLEAKRLIKLEVRIKQDDLQRKVEAALEMQSGGISVDLQRDILDIGGKKYDFTEIEDAKIAEEKALKKEKRDTKIKAKKDAEIAKLEKKLARIKKK